MIPELFTIPGPWAGRLVIAGRPRGGDWLWDEARDLRKAGVDVIVSLLEPVEASQLNLANEAPAFQANGLRFVSFPIPDRGIPASTTGTGELVANLTRDLGAGKNIAIHCRQSIGRAGLIAAAILASSGVEPERAIKIVSAARGQTIPETAEQRSWILRLPASAPLPL